MSRNGTIVVTAGIMLSLFLAAMESTVVATAMPTIVGALGGLSIYSWVFSAYMLASTTTVPIYGKLSDIYGRRPLFALGMVLFLTGSILSAHAHSMSQLILYRTLQGLGAGGLLTLAFIMVGDMFTFEQRARMQGLFSGVWGVSSIIGPLMGGFIVDNLSWHWVFYINILPGLVCLAIVMLAWRDQVRETTTRPAVDYMGTAFLSAGIVALLLGLFEFGTVTGWILLALAVVLLAILLWIERRVPDPIIPLALLHDRLFAAACGQGLMAGWATFGTTSFVPLFVQAVLGTGATRAGATLTPLLLGWVFASIIGSRMLLRVSYRSIAVAGMVLLCLGTFLLSLTGVKTSQIVLMVYLAMMGVGMGASVAPFLIAVQSTVRRRDMGTATASLQFSRSMGGAIGVSVMGAVLSLRLASNLAAAGLDPTVVSLNSLLDPLAQNNVALEGVLRPALAGAIHGVFIVAFVVAVLGLIVTFFAPHGRIAQLLAQRSNPDGAGQRVPESVGK